MLVHLTSHHFIIAVLRASQVGRRALVSESLHGVVVLKGPLGDNLYHFWVIHVLAHIVRDGFTQVGQMNTTIIAKLIKLVETLLRHVGALIDMRLVCVTTEELRSVAGGLWTDN